MHIKTTERTTHNYLNKNKICNYCKNHEVFCKEGDSNSHNSLKLFQTEM